jgi:hypothetical protein
MRVSVDDSQTKENDEKEPTRVRANVCEVAERRKKYHAVHDPTVATQAPQFGEEKVGWNVERKSEAEHGEMGELPARRTDGRVLDRQQVSY